MKDTIIVGGWEAPDLKVTPRPPSVITIDSSKSSPSPVKKSNSTADDVKNDCEIICIGNVNENYMEALQSNIKDFGLKVDVMYPAPSVKISSLIEILATRGTMFALVVRPENFVHESVSVHILRGPPKPLEHRNMPIGAAYTLIQQCYSDLKKQEIGPVPDNIKAIISFVLQGDEITDDLYGQAITFLQQRRERQAAFENRNGGQATMKLYTKEELERKIFAIISGAEESAVVKKESSCTGSQIRSSK